MSSHFLLQFCVGSKELYDETIGLTYGVPVLVMLLLIFSTDFYTFLNIDDYKQHSTSNMEEDNFLELVSKELNHLAAILHVYAGGLNFMK